MLETLLQLGEVLRKSQGGLKHHRYVKRAPQREPGNAKAIGNATEFFQVRVNDDGSFDFTNREAFENEYLIKQLLYLNYKTSDAESTKKYIFGDVFRVVNIKTGKDGGNFLKGKETGTDKDRNSFYRGRDIAATLDNALLRNFRVSFEAQIEEVVDHLLAHPNCYLHFDFNGLHWYQIHDVVEVINANLIDNFTVQIKVPEENEQKTSYSARPFTRLYLPR